MRFGAPLVDEIKSKLLGLRVDASIPPKLPRVLLEPASAVAEGIREGWSRDKPLDLNSATREQLLTLPGMTEAEADQVIAGRPYEEPAELVTRRILSKTEYDKISDRVTARR
jgi:competence protein ComEA